MRFESNNRKKGGSSMSYGKLVLLADAYEDERAQRYVVGA